MNSKRSDESTKTILPTEPLIPREEGEKTTPPEDMLKAFMKKNRKLFLVLSGVAVFLIGLFGTTNVLQKTGRTEIAPQSLLNPLPSATPSPMPFRELTIPYLREREYKSALGEFEKVSENGSYTSYVTSYDSDGLKIYGLLTIPNGPVPRSSESEAGWPAIVFVHGYIPPQSYQTRVNYASYVDYLARNGFVVFKIDLRGHGNSEGIASGAYYSGDYVIDALNARAALESADFVNPNLIGLWGHSMGGNIVFRAFTAKPEIPAVVIWAGAVYTYTDLQEFGVDDDSYRPPPQDSERQKYRAALRAAHGDFSPDSPFWKQVAPTNYLKDLKGAIQLHHAVNDNVVSVNYSRNLDALLNETTTRHELREYADGGHNLTGASFNLAMERTVAFFKENMK